jgi:phage gp29-like protein
MAKIVDIHGNPLQSKTLKTAQTAELALLRQAFAEHPSRGLTMQKLPRILEEAERGNLESQADLFCDMEERDGHIFAEMSKRKRALLTLDYSIVPPKGASAEEKRAAEAVAEWFDELSDVEDMMLDCLDGIGHGFAALELSWERVDNIWMPVKFEHRPQRWFKTLQEDGNALRLNDGTLYGAELNPFGWIVHRHKAKSGYLNRSGLHRILVWPYLFKNFSVRDLAEFLEIYGLPLRIGKYGSGASEDDKNTLLRAVLEVGHNAAAIIPEGMAIEFETAAQGQSDPYEAMMNWCERTQSKAILGGTLTSQADGKSSTNALGNVHNEVRHDLLVSDARQLAVSISRYLIYPMLALNGFGNLKRLPRFVFDTREVGDLNTYSESLERLVRVGMPVPVPWVQDKLAIPAPKEGEAVLTIPQPAASLPVGLSHRVPMLKTRHNLHWIQQHCRNNWGQQYKHC